MRAKDAPLPQGDLTPWPHRYRGPQGEGTLVFVDDLFHGRYFALLHGSGSRWDSENPWVGVVVQPLHDPRPGTHAVYSTSLYEAMWTFVGPLRVEEQCRRAH